MDERMDEQRGWRRTLEERWFVAALGLVLGLQLGVDAVLLSRSYFFAEDFGQLTAYADRPLGPDLLSTPVFGHFIPGFVLVQWVVGRVVGPSWLATSVLTCLVQVAGTVAFARLLVALRGRAWWVPWLTAAFALGVVTLHTVPWWAATLAPQLAVVASISTWGCALRWAHTRRARHLVGLAAAFVVAVSLFEKSLAVAAYLVLFVLVVGLGTAPSTWRARWRQAVGLWPVWAVLAVVGVLDLAAFVGGDHLDRFGPSASLGQTVGYLARSLPGGVLPSLLGAVTPVSTLPGPAWLTPALATAVWALVVVWTSVRSAIAARAWAWYVVAAAISQLLVARGRLRLLGTQTLVEDPRFQVDPAWLLLVALAVAVPAAVASTTAAVRARAALAAALAPVVLLPLWAQSVRVTSEQASGTATRAYLQPLRDAALPEGAAFLDLAVPEWVVPQALHPWNLASTVYPVARPGVRLTHDPTGALWVRPDGSVGPLRLEDVTTPTTGEVCLAPGDDPVEVLPAPGLALYDVPPPLLLVLDVRAEGQARLSADVAIGDAVPVEPSVDGPGPLAVPVSLSGTDAVHLAAEGARVCVSAVRLAVPAG